jgi:pentatricopeptide repeat protein
MRERNVIIDTITFINLMQAFANQGNTSGALLAFNSLADSGVTVDHQVCAALLKCYAKSGDPEGAGAFVDSMESRFNLSPIVYSFSITMTACAQAKRPDLAEQWWGKMMDHNVQEKVF